MVIIKHQKFTDKYILRNKGHAKKIENRKCVRYFSLWRKSKKDLDDSYNELDRVLQSINLMKRPRKETQKKLLRELNRGFKSFSMDLYSYKNKILDFLKNYLHKDPINEELFRSVENLFFSLPASFFIKLHNSYKHSGSFYILAFKGISSKASIDFYIINKSTKEEENYIGALLNGGDLVNYLRRVKKYTHDMEDDIFHNIVTRA